MCFGHMAAWQTQLGRKLNKTLDESMWDLANKVWSSRSCGKKGVLLQWLMLSSDGIKLSVENLFGGSMFVTKTILEF